MYKTYSDFQRFINSLLKLVNYMTGELSKISGVNGPKQVNFDQSVKEVKSLRSAFK